MRLLAELVTVVVGTITITGFIARHIVRRKRLQRELEHQALSGTQTRELHKGEED